MASQQDRQNEASEALKERAGREGGWREVLHAATFGTPMTEAEREARGGGRRGRDMEAMRWR